MRAPLRLSISSRLMSHFSAIISADRNWETSWSPYLSIQPGDSANGLVKPYCWATSMAAEIGMADMFCRPPATTRSSARSKSAGRYIAQPRMATSSSWMDSIGSCTGP